MSDTPDATTRANQAYLPDFCAASTVFVIVLIAELVAILLALAAFDTAGDFLSDLWKISFFVLWFAVLASALLCQLRTRLEEAGATRAFVLGFAILLGLCLLLTELAWQLSVRYDYLYLIDDSHAGFVLRSFSMGAIVIALAMRYLYISSEWRRSIVLEAQARISALQALIRPHFLFNSMNTIASLTRTDPRQAEEAVEDLSDLMRANLNSSESLTSLKQELEIAAIYQRIEKLRLGERLQIRWNVDDLPMRARIPSFTIQPLLENAIYHGIELLPDGGEVIVQGERDHEHLVISISNPVLPQAKSDKDGNKMAMANIRQRFELAYGNAASVAIDDASDAYKVTLRFPADEPDR